MKRAYLTAAAFAALLLISTGASAQDRNDQRFNDHDRQVTTDWYTQHQSHAPRGFRTSDRLTVEQEQRIQVGQPLERNLWRHSYSVPRDLSRRLPRVPRYHRYMAVGQHVVLMDTRNHTVRDVIDIHGGRH